VHDGALAFFVVIGSSGAAIEENAEKSENATLSAESSSSHVEISLI
jgi:hypothetical protein